jgi:Ca2+-binding EF-hand superfamily protein
MQRTFLLAWLLLSMPSADAQPLPAISEAETVLVRAVPLSGTTLARYLADRCTQFAMLDYDGDGAITPEDLELLRLARAAAQRAATMTQILSADLDGDGIVTRDELRDYFSGNVLAFLAAAGKPEAEERLRREIEAEIVSRMKADLNGDGRIDSAEMLAHAKTVLASQPVDSDPMAPIRMAAVLLAFDQDGDGRTRLAEYLAAAERIFRRIDTDGDGTISREEIANFRRQAGLR